MLYTLNLYSTACQLYLNKTERKKIISHSIVKFFSQDGKFPKKKFFLKKGNFPCLK